MRLYDQGIQQVLKQVRRENQSAEELRLAFLEEIERAKQESSIFAHEGRHLIDRRSRVIPVAAWKKEFNAKLSEVAFAPHPRISLGSIFSSNIGDRSDAHGTANGKIMKGIVDWMNRHRLEIEGLDSDRPLLPQFDKLSDEQIREVFQSMDPLTE